MFIETLSFTDKLLTTIALAIVTSVGMVILYAAVRTIWALIDWSSKKIDEWLDKYRPPPPNPGIQEK